MPAELPGRHFEANSGAEGRLLKDQGNSLTGKGRRFLSLFDESGILNKMPNVISSEGRY